MQGRCFLMNSCCSSKTLVYFTLNGLIDKNMFSDVRGTRFDIVVTCFTDGDENLVTHQRVKIDPGVKPHFG